MPLDRFITLRLARRWTPAASAAAPALPILMYHRIADDPEPDRPAFRRLCTSASRFADQMRWLAEAGWTGMDVTTALAAEGARAGLRRCAITFDDGLGDFLDTAAPVLLQHDFRATIYLPTAFIGETRAPFQTHLCLAWSEVRDLHRAGFEFGSHTVSHPHLRELPWCDVWREVATSKVRIEQELGASIHGFSYPFAFPQTDAVFAATTATILRAVGYAHAVTTIIGRATPHDDPFRLRRIPVSEADDRDLFLAKLEGAYDWLARPQAWAKAAHELARFPA